MDYNKWSGCTVDSCARKMRGNKKVSANYMIEETCRYAELGVCPLPSSKEKVEVDISATF